LVLTPTFRQIGIVDEGRMLVTGSKGVRYQMDEGRKEGGREEGRGGSGSPGAGYVE
jgi:hypothetical protein